MLLIPIIMCTLFVLTNAIGPLYPPTKGEVWPKAQQEQKGIVVYGFDSRNFEVTTTNQNCTLLWKAVNRSLTNIRLLEGISMRFMHNHIGDPNKALQAKGLQVQLTQPCEDYPHLNMDESYNLTVSETSILSSASVWGVMRGLETFSQLFYLSDDYSRVLINETQIFDFPLNKHRGLLLDTSRHYLSVDRLLTTLDGLSMNKLNVFHWHLVDDPSFPYQSETHPELSKKGAYHSSMVYTKDDITKIVEYARERGIRVLPEFDVPAHSQSWAASHPELVNKCGKFGALNPTKNETYSLLQDLFRETQELFPDKYFHLGGDEMIPYASPCWTDDPSIKQFMDERNMSVPDLHAYFMRRTVALLRDRTPVVWQEVYDEGIYISDETIVQVWTNGWINNMVKILKSGHLVLFSAAWYLDTYVHNTFESLYDADPRQMVYNATKNDTLLDNLIGGEGCLWGEMVDDNNVLTGSWPQACAVAEVLWSSSAPTVASGSRADHRNRIEEHTCRMNRRSVSAGPAFGPGFCLV